MLIKPGTKRRRTQAEVAMERDADELKESVARENEERIVELTKQLERVKEQSYQTEQYKDVVEEMVRQGVLEGDADNNFKLVEYDENGANVIR